MKNWKTTVGGILLGIGTPLAAAGEGLYKTVGTIMATIGGILVGLSARDANVSSKSMGLH